MKKLFKISIFILLIFTLSGCMKEDNMEDITIYTSIYPVEYVTERLYSNYSTILSMYPNDTNPYDYKLTKRQIKNFAQGNLIVYNGLGVEKEYIVEMLNNHKNLKIIDATARIEYTNSMDEIWINPSNILKISQNIRDGLKEYVTSNYIQKEIDNNYEKLKLEISTIDAEMKEMVENADNKYIIVSDDDFMFLEKYGFEIISLDNRNEAVSDRTIREVKDMIEDETVKHIIMLEHTENNDIIKEIIEDTNVETYKFRKLDSITDAERDEGKDYISIMTENIDLLKNELY